MAAIDAMWAAESTLCLVQRCLFDLMIDTGWSFGTDCQLARLDRTVQVRWTIPYFSTLANEILTGFGAGTSFKCTGLGGAHLLKFQYQ